MTSNQKERNIERVRQREGKGSTGKIAGRREGSESSHRREMES
ncbi:unnamed protein product [Camellia sinensis]